MVSTPTSAARAASPSRGLYQLVRQRSGVTEHTFEITFVDPGVHAYVFTFG